MKNILKVIILFCMIVGLFVIPSFADSLYCPLPIVENVDSNNQSGSATLIRDYGLYAFDSNRAPTYLAANSNYFLIFYLNNSYSYIVTDTIDNSKLYYYVQDQEPYYHAITATENFFTLDQSTGLYYRRYVRYLTNINQSIPGYADLNTALADSKLFFDNPPSQYSKNANVDEFIANTMISMGVKFDTPAYALSYAADAWDWCIDETNMETANPFDEWNIDAFVSYCNAQSNNYLNWYNGYKVSVDVTNALGEYIRQNIRSLTGLPAGITSVTGAYLPIYHYGSGFQSGVSSPTAQTFYPAQTITYFNGEYVNETDDISTSQFLYTPADVRRFLGYPGSSPVITPSTPAGTGTITDDPNNPDQKNITINFPSLDWLADAIKSLLDFLRDAFTTLANLLTQLLDAILGLFSDAFAGLADFGQGIIDFLQSVFAGLSTLLNGYVPSDLAVIIACFIALNFGVGLITFVLKGH